MRQADGGIVAERISLQMGDTVAVRQPDIKNCDLGLNSGIMATAVAASTA
jgi:hypothetical protein